MRSTLYRGEKVFEIQDCQEMMARAAAGKYGRYLNIGQEQRFLARMPRPEGHDSSGYAMPFSAAGIDEIPESDWDAAIDDQIARKARVSDHVDFQQFTQDGLPTCWAICTAQCYSVYRRILGLPHRVMSGCSLAVPISGGHRGGYEGDSLDMAVKEGIASTDVWPENNTSRSYIGDSRVTEDRKLHRVTMWLEMNTARQWATMLLRTKPGVFAYNWMSHCMTMCDFVRIEAGRYGFRPRNTWFPWGSKNDLGFDGFAVYPLGHGTPDSGAVMLDITQSEK